jgi:hypothetical protein
VRYNREKLSTLQLQGHPDIKQVEGRSTCSFSTSLLRAATFGDKAGLLNWAIYFTGLNLTKERLQQPTLRSDLDKTLMNVEQRPQWVWHLQQKCFRLALQVIILR